MATCKQGVKGRKRWVVLGVPGGAGWFAYDRVTREAVRCPSRAAAAAECQRRGA